MLVNFEIWQRRFFDGEPAAMRAPERQLELQSR